MSTLIGGSIGVDFAPKSVYNDAEMALRKGEFTERADGGGQYQGHRVPQPPFGSLGLRRLAALSIIAGLLLGSSAGMAVDAVSATPPYYTTRQALMGLLAGAIAPPVAAILFIFASRFFGKSATRSTVIRRILYATAGVLTGLACMVIYVRLPVPPFTAGLSLIIYPVAATLVFTPVAVFSETYEASYRRQQLIRDLFSRYVSPDVVDQLLLSDGPVALSGERRPITVLFSDIRGFSRLSQEMAPDSVVSSLNEYFALMVDIVFQFGGTIDKFTGDGMMVLFGAPLSQGDEPQRAVRTAQAMQAAVRELNIRRGGRGEMALGVGIGIDSGEAVTGNIGSPRRLEYTAIGVVVNNASYLSKLAQSGQNLVTSATQGCVAAEYIGHEWRLVTMRGADQPTRVYEINSPVDGATPSQHSWPQLGRSL